MATKTIREMISKNLVDGLNISGELTMRGRCKDCIFGKHSSHPFNKKGYQKTEVLESIHINIWGLSQTQSAGGVSYFMLLMDGYSSYKTITFLKTKSADTILQVLKNYHIEAERQTGKALKQVRLDMGREWHNNVWEDYRKENGLVFEFTTPYAYQQNGAAECSMWTILDGAQTAMAKSRLPLKYWADAVQTTVYTCNFVPSHQNPSQIPTELWYEKQQNISHLRPFGATAYAHIPSDLNLSKLYPRSVKTLLLGYFGREGYKLLKRETGQTFRSQDVIFEEDDTNFTLQGIQTQTYNENDPLPINTDQCDNHINCRTIVIPMRCEKMLKYPTTK